MIASKSGDGVDLDKCRKLKKAMKQLVQGYKVEKDLLMCEIDPAKNTISNTIVGDRPTYPQVFFVPANNNPPSTEYLPIHLENSNSNSNSNSNVNANANANANARLANAKTTSKSKSDLGKFLSRTFSKKAHDDNGDGNGDGDGNGNDNRDGYGDGYNHHDHTSTAYMVQHIKEFVDQHKQPFTESKNSAMALNSFKKLRVSITDFQSTILKKS